MSARLLPVLAALAVACARSAPPPSMGALPDEDPSEAFDEPALGEPEGGETTDDPTDDPPDEGVDDDDAPDEEQVEQLPPGDVDLDALERALLDLE